MENTKMLPVSAVNLVANSGNTVYWVEIECIYTTLIFDI